MALDRQTRSRGNSSIFTPTALTAAQHRCVTSVHRAMEKATAHVTTDVNR